MAYVMHCAEADFDALTQTCAQPQWSLDTGGFPPLPVSDALEIGAATLLLWATAYGVRALLGMVRNR